MRYLWLISLLFQSLYATTVFESEGFAIELKDNHHFLAYPKENAAFNLISGDYVEQSDSLILSTHEFGGEKAIFAIFQQEPHRIKPVYIQKAYRKVIREDFMRTYEYYTNGRIKTEYYWEDKSKLKFTKYEFNSSQWIVSLTQYNQGVKEGKELIFFDSPHGVIHEERSYEEGQLSGKTYLYEAVDKNYLQVELSQIKIYKEGELVKIKKPATPPIFYTSHF